MDKMELKLDELFTITTTFVALLALRMQPIARLLGSPVPFIFYFPLKLIGADHGLHIFGGVQIS